MIQVSRLTLLIGIIESIEHCWQPWGWWIISFGGVSRCRSWSIGLSISAKLWLFHKSSTTGSHFVLIRDWDTLSYNKWNVLLTSRVSSSELMLSRWNMCITFFSKLKGINRSKPFFLLLHKQHVFPTVKPPFFWNSEAIRFIETTLGCSYQNF